MMMELSAIKDAMVEDFERCSVIVINKHNILKDMRPLNPERCILASIVSCTVSL